MKRVQNSSQTIGAFLEWLITTKHLVIAKWEKSINDDDEAVESLEPAWFGSYGIEGLLAEYFGIDLKKAETERQAILEEFRKHNP
jgi:hypothetical protein